MVFPILNRRAAGEIKISDFSGGVNLRDGLSEIMDNQATDIKNMWWRDGIMKTRPAHIIGFKIPYDGFMPSTANESFTDFKSENAAKAIAGRKFFMVSRHDSYYTRVQTGDSLMPKQSHISFAWINGTESAELPAITSADNSVVRNYFVAQHKKDILCFIYTEDIGGVKGGAVYRLAEDEKVWTKVANEEMYVPLLYAHCVVTSKDSGGFKGTQIEGLNILGDSFRMIYSTVNKELLNAADENSSHFMTYTVPLAGEAGAVERVESVLKVKITQKNGDVVTHTVKKSGAEWVENDYNTDELLLSVGKIGGGQLLLNFEAKGGGIAKVKASDYIEDNMEIIAPCTPDETQRKKVFCMTQTVWFGGDALGISGGTRLFLGGNTEGKETNLVLWSGLDNPLYFPENCYAYIGNSNQAVTAFGRQNDTLVIFKEHETYYTQYMRNDNITAEDLINQNVVDYAASSVYFPIVQLHPAIGCDCPDTVQLCRNRLVWACTDGCVYTLMTQSQYSERNIYTVSEMVRPALKKETGLNTASSCDWDGHYLLCAGSRIYIMDYESYGYANASSYSKTEDANIRIPWWIWEINGNIVNAFSSDGTAFFCGPDSAGLPEDISLAVIRLETEACRDYDGTSYSEIESEFTSKLFDFGLPNIRKKHRWYERYIRKQQRSPYNRKVYNRHGDGRTHDNFRRQRRYETTGGLC